MTDSMRLYQHRKYWYVYHKGKRTSLKTKDGRIAKGIFAKMQRDQLYKEAAKITKETAVKLSEFVEYYNAAADRQDLSVETPKSIKSAINSLIKYAGDIPVSDVTREVIDRYKLDAQAELKPSSINSYITHFNAALNYAARQSIIPEHTPFAKIRTGKRQRRVIMPDDLEKLKAAADPDMLRVIRVALWTGARRSELINMRYEHKYGGMIRIVGKGDKERSVPLMGDAREILGRQHIGKVFPRWNHPIALSAAFKRLADKAGVKARLHDLRHTAATEMLRKGVMLSAVQRVLGHASINTTQIYADVLEETLMNEMRKMEETN